MNNKNGKEVTTALNDLQQADTDAYDAAIAFIRDNVGDAEANDCISRLHQLQQNPDKEEMFKDYTPRAPWDTRDDVLSEIVPEEYSKHTSVDVLPEIKITPEHETDNLNPRVSSNYSCSLKNYMEYRKHFKDIKTCKTSYYG